MLFYVGMHDLHCADRLPRVCISVNRLRRRKRPVFPVNEWICDSGAFTELSTHGRYREDVAAYAAEVRRYAGVGRLVAVVAQDYMCEPYILAKTGLTVREHQRLTLERYEALLAEPLPAPVLPVVQGYAPKDYAVHVAAYGDRLAPGAWVGVGSVCKRNGRPEAVAVILDAIHAVRPDLRLHGFGLKRTALAHPGVLSRLHSADSMAWSYHARRNGLDRNGWTQALAYAEQIATSVGRLQRLSLA